MPAKNVSKPKLAIVMPKSKQAAKTSTAPAKPVPAIAAATTTGGKAPTTKPVPTSVATPVPAIVATLDKPVSKAGLNYHVTPPVPAAANNTGTTQSAAAATAKKHATAVAKPVPATATPTTPKASTLGNGYAARAGVKPQLYGADSQSPRDDAYLRFFASFLRGRAATSTITYAEIVERQRPAQLRNPLPGAGGKNGCADRGIFSRFDKFGHTVNVVDPNDKSRRIGFRFSDKALALASVKAGMRDVYVNGLLT